MRTTTRLPQFCRNTEQTQKVMKRQNEKFVERNSKKGTNVPHSKHKRKKMDDSISRGGVEKTPRVLVSHKRPRSEDEAFNDDEFEDDGDFEEMNGGFSSRRRRRNSSTNPLLLTERQKAPSTAFNSLKILQNSSSCKKRGKKLLNSCPSSAFLQLRSSSVMPALSPRPMSATKACVPRYDFLATPPPMLPKREREER